VTDTRLMEHLSSRDIADAIAAGTTRVIIPMGSIEAHGDHLPIGTDCIVSSHLANMVAERLGDALVAPVIATGHAPRTRFPGTISFPVDLVVQVLAHYLEALEHDGFRTVVILPMHAESFQTLQLFAPELGRRFPALTIVPTVDVAALLLLRGQVGLEHGITGDEAGWHAGAAETAEMLAIAPDRVRGSWLREGYLGPSGFNRPLPETYRNGWAVLDERGVMGDPRKATAEYGHAILEALAVHLADAVRASEAEAPAGQGVDA
jgi:creatinine amidohydrolase